MSTDSTDALKLLILNSTAQPEGKDWGGICIPSGMQDAALYEKIFATLMDMMNEGFGSYIKDIAESWVVLIIMSILVVLITFVYIQLLRYATKPILYGSLLLITILLILCTYFTYDNTTKFTD